MIVYLCDDRLDCFYTAVFTAYQDHKLNCKITSAAYQPTFDETAVKIQASIEKTTRVKNAILKIAGRNALDDIKTALRSCDEEKQTKAFNYVKLTISENKDVSKYFSHPAVIAFNELKNRVLTERHRFTGFLRFSETVSGVLYAVYEPDNDVTDILAPFFKARLGKTPFVIHDRKRNVFALWSGNEMRYIKTDEPITVVLSDKENFISGLWKKYFTSVNIESRPHKKQQDGYLPRRYRKFMNEFLQS